MLSRLGGVGVFILAALDSSLLPTLGAVDAPFWRPFSISRRTSSAGISDFRVRNWCRRSTLSVPLVRIVFRRRASVPLCSAGLPCLCVRPAVRDERLVGAHAGGSSGGRRCAGLCRVAGVAHLEEI
jgi:hypothetical protein